MQFRIATNALLLLGLAYSTAAGAAPDTGGVCDDLSGAAQGLCVAAVKADCGTDGVGNTNACAKLADRFEATTGARPPWLAPKCLPNWNLPWPSCPAGTEPMPVDYSCFYIDGCHAECGTAGDGFVCSQLDNYYDCETYPMCFVTLDGRRYCRLQACKWAGEYEP